MYWNCHSWFSFLYGVMSPEQLLQQAAARQLTVLGLTDINNTSGLADFHRLAPQYGIRPVAGIEFRQGMQLRFVGLARTLTGLRQLNELLTDCLQRGSAELTGRAAVVPPQAPCLQDVFIIYPFSEVQSREPVTLQPYEYVGVRAADLNRLRFSPWRHHLQRLVVQAPVTFRHRTDYNTHRLLRAMDNNTLLSKLPAAQQAAADEVLGDEAALCRQFADLPALINNTRQLLDGCDVLDFAFGQNKNRRFFTGTAADDAALLRKLSYDQLPHCYPQASAAVRERLEQELRLIVELGFAAYFLINWDIVRYAQSRNFFYVGRGSGANSLVAYLLRITNVDPIELDLYFERFINPYRTSPPDFDIDFSWKDRDEIIDYIFKRYRTTHTALLATYITFQERSVVRELGKVFGLPKRDIDALQDPQQFPDVARHTQQLVWRYARRLHNMPRQLSIHAGGMLISELPMTTYTALSQPPKGFPLTQFSMLEAEDLGLYKFDILSQRGLGHMKDAVELIGRNRGVRISINDVSRFKQDERVRRHLKEARLMGCFYVESPAMRALLTKLRAETYRDLVAASSIIRPGVASSGMMREYIERFHDPQRARREAIPELLALLPETFGVMVYQEDVIRVAHHFAGLTLGEADMLRRGMSGKYRGRAEFKLVEQRFFEGCRQKGHSHEKACEVWRQIESFAGYAFAKGHSASFAVESYQSMFLKAHYPIEFMVAVINNFGGFYATEFYVHEARRSGATIHAPHINCSEELTTVQGDAVYLGFGLIRDLTASTAQAVVQERQRRGPYHDLADFMTRLSLPAEQVCLLVRAGAFRHTGRSAREMLWEVYGRSAGRSTAASLLPDTSLPALPPLDADPWQEVREQIELLGFPLCSPFALIDPALADGPVAADFPALCGKVIELTGYFVTSKPTTTVKGERMMFGTFLDRNGDFLDTTHFPDVARRYPFRGKGCYRIRGRVVEDFGYHSIEVLQMHPVPYRIYEADASAVARRRPDPPAPRAVDCRLYRYEVALLLPDAVAQEVRQLLRHVGARAGLAVAGGRQARLLRLEAGAGYERQLRERLLAVAAAAQPVNIRLSGVRPVPPADVAFGVVDGPSLTDLRAALLQALADLPCRVITAEPLIPVLHQLKPQQQALAHGLLQQAAVRSQGQTRQLLLLRADTGSRVMQRLQTFRLGASRRMADTERL